jgi:hypothetical protein
VDLGIDHQRAIRIRLRPEGGLLRRRKLRRLDLDRT